MKPIRILVLLLLSGTAACGPADPGHRPNVILIVMDTTRADRCSLNGYHRPTTPKLEALAREGMTFRNTWSPASWTGPAHASMFTGLLPENHGFLRGNREYLGQNSTTLAERLSRAGYGTACITNNQTISPEFGMSQGFDRYAPLYAGRNRAYPYGPSTHRMAIEWIEEFRADKKPFFMFINNMEAHFPYTPPEYFREKFRNPATDPAESKRVARLDVNILREHNFGVRPRTPSELGVMSDLYDAEIACLDETIGRFVDQLRAAGVLDETLLIITADHGENLGEHGLVDHMFSIHRTIRHVPLLIRLPGGERAGEVIDEVVRLEDLYPTVLEVCGLPIREGLDGASVLGQLGNRPARAMGGAVDRFVNNSHRVFGGTFAKARFMLSYRAILDGRIHWIWSSDGVVQAFDVLADPAETTPLPIGDGELQIPEFLMRSGGNLK